MERVYKNIENLFSRLYSFAKTSEEKKTEFVNGLRLFEREFGPQTEYFYHGRTISIYLHKNHLGFLVDKMAKGLIPKKKSER